MPEDKPHSLFTAARSPSIQPCHPTFKATFSVSVGALHFFECPECLLCLHLTALSTGLHNAFMDVWYLASVKADRSCVLHLCSSIQPETDLVNWKLVEVNGELMPLISPAVTWGRKGGKKQGRDWCIMQKVLSSLWATTTLCTPLLFILHFFLYAITSNVRVSFFFQLVDVSI